MNKAAGWKDIKSFFDSTQGQAFSTEIDYVDEEVQAALDSRYSDMLKAAFKARGVALACLTLAVIKLPYKLSIAMSLTALSMYELYRTDSQQNKFVRIIGGVSGILLAIGTFVRTLSFPVIHATGFLCPEMTVRLLKSPLFSQER